MTTRAWTLASLAFFTSLAVGAGLYATFASSRSANAQPVPTCDTPTSPFCNARVALPPNWPAHIFALSQNYPTAAPADAQPWLAFDPRTQPAQYANAVLSYFYEGNLRPSVEDSFDPKLNTVRHWYNAPWQDFGTNPREPAHGLTGERYSRKQELDPHQVDPGNNYAIGFYNAPGGVVIGRVWANHGKPNAAAALMPEGTVAAKLIFTTAPVSEVPYLQGAPSWQVYVAGFGAAAPSLTIVRLLQIDIAVKDKRVASATGWVFGTFVYGGGPGGPAGSGWANVAPVGLMWGNDPGFSGTGKLNQTWLNPAVHMKNVGYQGRLIGPIDNPASSCLSCHATAEDPSGSMTAPKGTNPARWFQNVPSGTAFDPGRQSLDYSLQLMVGLANFANAQDQAHAPTAAVRFNLVQKMKALSSRPPRDGGPLR